METTSSETASSLLNLSNGLADAVERASGAVVAVNARQRIPSSGIVWREGVIVTAAHSVKREEEISVTLPDGRSVAAAVAGRDSGTDLAVLKVEGVGPPTAETANASSLKVGHLVLALGRAGERGSLCASLGVISALSGPWRTWRGGEIDRFVRLDLALYPGFSGGPLVDVQGRVLGINTSGLSRSAGIAVPASTVNRVADELLKKGRIARGYLGLGMHPVSLPDMLRNKLNLHGKSGVIILSVEAGGPADRAGLLIGDVLVAFDGQDISDTEDVQAVLGPERVGKEVKATLIRGGAPVELNITVGERLRKSR
jgi:serine protease DegQ